MENEHASVIKMWEDYLFSIGEDIEDTNKSYTSWYFCSDKESADNLAKLVLQGTKRGTASLYDIYDIDDEELPKVYDYSIITNWDGAAQCIIRTKKIIILPFKDVNEEMAEIEGEGDKSLEYWRRVHIDFFEKELEEYNMKFSKDMPVVFEEFEVVYK